MSNAYVPVALEPLGESSGDFAGIITHSAVDDIEFTLLRSSGQRVIRTQRLISRSTDEVLYIGICIGGSGRVQQDGRLAELRQPGEMVFVDSRRPNWWESDGEHEQLVVQVPFTALERGGWTQPTTPAARTVTPDSAAGLVSEYLREVAGARETDPAAAARLGAHVLPLLTSALTLTAGELPSPEHGRPLERLRALTVMRHRCPDADVTVDDIAAECLLSRSALYRLFDRGPGVLARLWTMRVERAKTLLGADPAAAMSVVAAASGFRTERQFFRVFRDSTGVTPTQWRDGHRPA